MTMTANVRPYEEPPSIIYPDIDWHPPHSSSDLVKDCQTTIFIWKEPKKWALLDCYLRAAILITSQMLQLLCKLGRQNIFHWISEKWKGVGPCRLAHGYILQRSSENCNKIFFEEVAVRHVFAWKPTYIYTDALAVLLAQTRPKYTVTVIMTIQVDQS